jgi:hypothetical protein
MTPEDRGIHRTQEDIWEEELKAAGWKPMAAHPRSPIWVDPNPPDPKYRLVPGPGYAWLVMKERQQAGHKVT